MEFVFEIIFQFILELLLQAFFELLAELGVRSLADPFKKPPNPYLSTVGYTLWGALAGGISLLLFPSSAIHDPLLRQVNLIATPLAMGLVMMLLGRQRSRKGQIVVRLDRFGFAFVFAFSMALVRYIWAA